MTATTTHTKIWTVPCGALCIIQVATRGVAGLGADLAGCLLGDAVDVVNCAARRLYASGAVGEGVRDAITRQITIAALEMAQSQGGKCTPGPRGLHLCVVPKGADVNVRLGSTDVRIQIYDKGGTTIGNVFITDEDRRGDGPLLDHELFHTFQWAAAGGLPFAALYGNEYAKAGGECNRFEQAAGFVAGHYPHCVGLL